MGIASFALLLLTAAPPAPVLARLNAAVAAPEAHLEVKRYEERISQPCTIEDAQVDRVVATSGKVAVQLRGRDARGGACDG